MKSRILAAVTAVAAVAAIAPAAASANDTISYDGGTLVFSGNGDSAVDVIAYEGATSGYVRFSEYTDGQSISFPGDRCQVVSDGADIECQAPSAMRVVGTSFDDQFSLGSGFPKTMPVSMSGGDGKDRLKDDYSADMGRTFDGGAGNDTIEAYKGKDVLIGGPGDDTLKGGAGADEVRGGDGNDTLEGDAYEDPAPDVIDGGPGFDVMEEYSIPDRDVNPPASVTQDGVANDGRPGENDNVTGVEKITSHVAGTFNGTDGDDDINVWGNITSGPSTINGGAGNDKLTGSDSGSDTINGGPGDDTIQGGYDNDTIVGGPGKDKINSDGGSYCGIYECTVPFGDDTVDVRDGEVDQVECGIGNDAVLADDVDVVAPSCENVTRSSGNGGGGGTGGGSGSGGGGGGGQATGAGQLGFAMVGGTRLKALRSSGARFRVTCAGACKVSGTLYKGSRKVGSGSRTLISAGTATVKVKLSKAGRKALRSGRRAKLTLKVSVKDGAGATQSLKKALTFK